MNSARRIFAVPWVQRSVGLLAAEYLRLVWKTSSLAIEPADIYTRVIPDLPAIVAMWHGQHFMMPFFRRGHRVKVLISRHRDGEINAIAAERLGLKTIRASGSIGGDFGRKGGVAGFMAMLDALADGYNVALTADVPKIARVAGRGIVHLARASGRPIYPVAPATSRRIELRSWDRCAINLPFSRFAIAIGEPIRVAADADETAIEHARRRVEAGLNAATERAYAMADGRADFAFSYAEQNMAKQTAQSEAVRSAQADR